MRMLVRVIGSLLLRVLGDLLRGEPGPTDSLRAAGAARAAPADASVWMEAYEPVLAQIAKALMCQFSAVPMTS